MIILLDDQINEESVEKFINKINDCKIKKEITIYLNSHGGFVRYIPLLKSIIEKYQLNLVASNRICSAALVLFLTTNTERSVLEGCIGMYHRTLWDLEVTGNLKFTDDKSFIKLFKKHNDSLLTENFLGLSQKQIKQVEKGRDIWFSSKKLKKALEKSKKHFEIKK